MIRLTRLNHVQVVLNSDLIEHMEATPDTILTLTTGQKIVILESAEEVLDRIIEFRRSIYAGLLFCPLLHRAESVQAVTSRPPTSLVTEDGG